MSACRVAVAVVWLGLVLWTGPAAAASARLYELTESMKIVGTQRVATAQLMGFARPGAPLCSAAVATSTAVLKALARPMTRCTINATGSDSISLQTGQGTLRGRFTVVVQGDNFVDSPELVVTSGQFRGQMDFSPAILAQVPYGTVTGVLTLDTGEEMPFRGTFRLPFDGAQLVQGVPLRNHLCGKDALPNPKLGGPDIKYLATEGGAPNGKCIDVAPMELSLGFPTVRFDVDFLP